MHRLLPALLVAALLGCGEGRVLVVRVENPSGTALSSLSVEVVAQAPGVAPSAPRGAGVFRRLDLFRLRLDEAQEGSLVIRVAGLGTDGCRVVEGQVTADLAAAIGEVSVTLLPGPRGCRLQVRQDGDGDGLLVGEESGVRCALAPGGGCDLERHVAERVRFRAEPAAGSYFLGWTGACRGVGDCEVEIGDGVVTVGASLHLREVKVDGFTWENPLPQGGLLSAIFSVSRDEAWAVGVGGVILHWNGTFWAPVPSGLPKPVALTSIWGRRSDDVSIAGARGTLLHWDGASFSAVPSGTTLNINDLWGSADGTVLAACGLGVILRWDGAAWGRLETGTQTSLFAIHGRDARHFTAVGADGTIVRQDGDALTQRRVIDGFRLTGVWTHDDQTWVVGSAAQDRSGVVLRLRGGAVEEVLPTKEPLLEVWGSGPDDVWVAGVLGFIARYQGSSRRVIAGQNGELLAGVYSISGSGPDDVWFADGAGDLRRWNGAYLGSTLGGATRDRLLGVFAGPDATWAVSAGGRLLRDGGAGWAPEIISQPFIFWDVWAGAGKVWIAGSFGAVLRWDRGTLKDMGSPLGYDLHGLWGFVQGREAEVWAVGDSGTVLRSTGGGAVQVIPSGVGAHLNGIWGSAPDDLWMIGDGGTLLRWDGVRMERVETGTTMQLLGISGWGRGASQELWIVGSPRDGAPPVLRFRGGKAVPVALPSSAMYPEKVLVRGERDVWIAGLFYDEDYFGGLMHWDGTSFERPLLPGVQVHDLDVAGDQMWAVGEGGAILHRRSP